MNHKCSTWHSVCPLRIKWALHESRAPFTASVSSHKLLLNMTVRDDSWICSSRRLILLAWNILQCEYIRLCIRRSQYNGGVSFIFLSLPEMTSSSSMSLRPFLKSSSMFSIWVPALRRWELHHAVNVWETQTDYYMKLVSSITKKHLTFLINTMCFKCTNQRTIFGTVYMFN